MRKFHQSRATPRSASRSSTIHTSDSSRISEAPAAQPAAITEKQQSIYMKRNKKKDKTLLRPASPNPESSARFTGNRFNPPLQINHLPKTVTFTMFFNALRYVLPNNLKPSRPSPQLFSVLTRFSRFFLANALLISCFISA